MSKKIIGLLFIVMSLSFTACSTKYIKTEEIKSLDQEVAYTNVSEDSNRSTYGVVHAVDQITIYSVDENSKYSAAAKRLFTFGMGSAGEEAVAVPLGTHAFYLAYKNIVNTGNNLKLTFEVQKDHDYAIRSCLNGNYVQVWAVDLEDLKVVSGRKCSVN